MCPPRASTLFPPMPITPPDLAPDAPLFIVLNAGSGKHATAPVRAKYGAAYADIIQRIDAVQ